MGIVYFINMEGLLHAFFADPMYYIGLCFAFVAAVAFLTFIRGVFTSLPHLFTISTHAGHLKHYHFRVVWGVTGLLGLLLAWETLRWALASLGIGSYSNAGALGSLWTVFLVVGAILWVLFSIKKVVVDKDH